MQRSPADPRDLISAASPLPWFRQATLLHGPDHGGIDIGPLRGEIYDEPDAALIVYSVNNLPALLDVAEAANELSEALLPYGTQGRYHAPLEPIAKMRRALARLRGESRDD